jgi:hypothetical protein
MLRAWLLPDPPRHFRWGRWTQVLFRSAHIAGMALLVGALPFTTDHRALRAAIWLTVLSGLGLWALDLMKSCAVLFEGAGVALLLKLLCLALGFAFPQARFQWYLAAVVVASVGSHMPGRWRHYSFLEGRVLDA